MNHHRLAITGILLAQLSMFGIPTLADTHDVTPENVDTESTEWKECVALLRLDPEIAVRGTYKIRVTECVNEKLRNKEVGDVDREHRLTIRARQVRDAFRSGRLGTTARSVSTQKAAEIEGRRYVPTTNFRRFRTVTPTQRSNETDNSDYSRPSRRSIKAGALQLTRSSKDRASDEYQEKWLAAVKACEGITNHFHRSNCIRRNLEQTQR